MSDDETCARLVRERDKARAENERLRAALIHVRSIIKDGAATGFNWQDGDWAERLYASQAVTHAALK